MRKTRKQMVGKVEDAEREVRETEYHGIERELHQQWRWQVRRFVMMPLRVPA